MELNHASQYALGALAYLDEWESRVVAGRKRRLDGGENDGAYKVANYLRLFSYQRDAVKTMVERGRTFNLDSMGLGKTAQSISALATLRAKCLPKERNDYVICPGYLRHNWGQELKIWWEDSEEARIAPAQVVLIKSAKDYARLDPKGGPKIIVCSYDLLPRIQLLDAPVGTVILDESHYVKNRTTRRYKAIEPLCRRASAVFLLSGTPAPNCPREYFSQIQLMHPGMFGGNYYAFADRYCAGRRDHFGHYDDRDSSNEQELAKLIKRISIRRRREDLPDLLEADAGSGSAGAGSVSDITTVTVTVEPAPTATGLKRRFTALRCDFEALLRQQDTSADQSASRRAAMQRAVSEMFRATCTMKRAPVAEFVKDYMAAGHGTPKTIFFCKHVMMVNAVTEALTSISCPHIEITGGTPLPQRTKLVETFLDPSAACRAAVLTLGSCSTGLNLAPVSRMVFCELDFNPSIILQACARINRVKGSASHLEYTYLLCEGTLDEMVYKKMKRKTKLAELIVDGGRDFQEFL